MGGFCLCFIGDIGMCVSSIGSVGVWAYCESCMYLVCRVSVFSFRWSGVRRVELQLRVCCEWGVIGDQVAAVVRDCSFTVGSGVMGVSGGVALWVKSTVCTKVLL